LPAVVSIALSFLFVLGYIQKNPGVASRRRDIFVAMSLPEKWPTLAVVVVGSYNTDLVVWCEAIPTRGESLMGGEFDMFCGGRGANCAVAAARAGCQVKFVGAHGTDVFGKMAVERLEREGLDISDFIELPASTTGTALMFQERTAGAHAALITNSANNQFPASLVTKVKPAIQEADLIFTQFEIGSSALLELFRLCDREKKRLVVHAAPVGPSTHLPNGYYYLFVLDDFEVLSLTRQTDLFAAIRDLHRCGVRNVIVKHGNGSLTFSDGINCRVQSIPSVPIVQDAGAVECLTAWSGIALALTGDLSWAAYVGALAMAFSLSRHGAQDSMPYRSELSMDWPVTDTDSS
jgi:ribokinase